VGGIDHDGGAEFTAAQADVLAAMSRAKKGKRRLAIPGLHGGVAFCAAGHIQSGCRDAAGRLATG